MLFTLINSVSILIASTTITTVPFSSVVERSTCTSSYSNAEVIRSIRVGGINFFGVLLRHFWTWISEGIIFAQREHHVLHLEHSTHHGAKQEVVLLRIARVIVISSLGGVAPYWA